MPFSAQAEILTAVEKAVGHFPSFEGHRHWPPAMVVLRRISAAIFRKDYTVIGNSVNFAIHGLMSYAATKSTYGNSP